MLLTLREERERERKRELEFSKRKMTTGWKKTRDKQNTMTAYNLKMWVRNKTQGPSGIKPERAAHSQGDDYSTRKGGERYFFIILTQLRRIQLFENRQRGDARVDERIR